MSLVIPNVEIEKKVLKSFFGVFLLGNINRYKFL